MTTRDFQTTSKEVASFAPDDVYTYGPDFGFPGQTRVTLKGGRALTVIEPFSLFHSWVIHPTLAPKDEPANTTTVVAKATTKRKGRR